MATDTIVEAVEQGQGHSVSFAGIDRSYFVCKPRRLAPGAVPKSTKLFVRRTNLKLARAKEQAARRAAGQHPWKPFPIRTGKLQPTLEHSPDGQAGQPPLKVYPAFAAWTELPQLVDRPWCSIMAADHGRSVRNADVVVLGNVSDLHLRTPCVARPSVHEDETSSSRVVLLSWSACNP
jgi:hypothetical protein